MSTIDITEIASALAVSEDDIAERHCAVQDVLRWFTFGHLPIGAPRKVSILCAELAGRMLAEIPVDDPELTRGLSRLLEAKDCLVRAAIAAGKASAE